MPSFILNKTLVILLKKLSIDLYSLVQKIALFCTKECNLLYNDAKLLFQRNKISRRKDKISNSIVIED